MMSKLRTIITICIVVLTAGLISFKLASIMVGSMEHDEDVFGDLD